MDRLETIDEDYYCGGAVFGGIAPGRRIGGGSDVDSDSSDDAIQRQMRRIADGREQDVDDSMDDSDGDRQGPSSKGGRRQVETVSTKRPSVSTSKPKENKSDFEAEMDNLLTTDLLTFSAGWMPELQEKLRAKREHKAIQPGASPSTTQCVPEKSGRKKFASPKKRVRFEEAAGGSAETVLQSESTDAQVNDADVDESLGLHDTETNSDDEFCTSEGITDKKQPPNPDDIFYDPQEDAANEKWVENRRRKSQGEHIDKKAMPTAKLPNSDAVLNCPACMTLLCLDCQRHSFFKTQYRAMFVENCHVNRAELLHMPAGNPRSIEKITPSQKRARKKRAKNERNRLAAVEKRKMKNLKIDKTDKEEGKDEPMDRDAEWEDAEEEDDEVDASELVQPVKVNARYQTASEQPPGECAPADLFFPVLCGVCRTEVGVFDRDEVYHFFHVISSYT